MTRQPRAPRARSLLTKTLWKSAGISSTVGGKAATGCGPRDEEGNVDDAKPRGRRTRFVLARSEENKPPPTPPTTTTPRDVWESRDAAASVALLGGHRRPTTCRLPESGLVTVVVMGAAVSVTEGLRLFLTSPTRHRMFFFAGSSASSESSSQTSPRLQFRQLLRQL